MTNRSMDAFASERFSLAWQAPCMRMLDRLLLITVAKHSMKHGYCWARQRHLAEICCASQRSIQRSLARLVAAGYVTRTPRYRPDGSRAASRLQLNLAVMRAAASPALERGEIDLGEVADDVDDWDAFLGDGEAHSPWDAPGRADPDAGSGVTMAEHEVGISKIGNEVEILNTSMSDSFESDVRGKAIQEEYLLDEDITEETRRVADAIWEASTEMGRRRSSRDKLLRAVDAHLGRRLNGGPLTGAELIQAWRWYVREGDGSKDDGQYQKGPDLWIRTGRYEAEVEFAREEARLAARPVQAAPGVKTLGTNEAPSELGMELWMRSYMRDRMWPEKRGPEPGEKGCRVSPDIQRRHGVRPWEDRQ